MISQESIFPLQPISDHCHLPRVCVSRRRKIFSHRLPLRETASSQRNQKPASLACPECCFQRTRIRTRPSRANQKLRPIPLPHRHETTSIGISKTHIPIFFDLSTVNPSLIRPGISLKMEEGSFLIVFIFWIWKEERQVLFWIGFQEYHHFLIRLR